MGGSGASKHVQNWQKSGKYFNYGKEQVFYKDEENPESETEMTVVCFHGWPTCSYDYRKVWDDFKRKFRRVIAIDYIGMGFSSKPTDYDYTFSKHADYIEELLVNIGVTDFHIAARALSNVTSAELLRRYDHRQREPVQGPLQNLKIKSISFTNGMVFTDVYSPPGGHEGTSILTSGCGPCAAKILPYPLFKTLLSEIYGPQTKPTEQELKDYWYAMNHENGRQAQPKFLAFVDEWKENGDTYVEVYKATSVPFQDIHGPSGPVIQIEKFEPRWRQEFPGARLDKVADHVGHFVQTEDPKGYVEAYFSFLDSVNSQIYPSLPE